jgi:hypothetical protein
VEYVYLDGAVRAPRHPRENPETGSSSLVILTYEPDSKGDRP